MLVGGGPGEPDFVTVAARHALASADVVVADRLAPRELLDELGPHVELIDVAKLPRGRSATQEAINEVIVDRARAGKRVVRFKGGDNFVFGRGFEELLACAAADVPVTVVPGLTSAISVPARVGIPVTHRGVAHEFTVISGHLPPGHPDSLVAWDARGADARHGRPADGGRQRPGHRGRAGRRRPAAPTPRWRSSSTARCRPSAPCSPRSARWPTTSSRNDVRPPAIIVIGDVVAVARPAHFPRG